MRKTLLKIKTEDGVVKCIEENNNEIKFHIGPNGVSEKYKFSTSDEEVYRDRNFLYCGKLEEYQIEYDIFYKNENYFIYKRVTSNSQYYYEIEKIADISSENIKWDNTSLNLNLL